MKICIIGSDSFIAKSFILNNFNKFYIKGISRISTHFENEVICDNFFLLTEEDFIGFDVVVNFAAIVHRPDIKDNEAYNLINHQLVINSANLSKKAGIKLFVQMSSIAVYDDLAVISQNSCYRPISPYGISKLKADLELLLMQDNSFKVSIIRPPMVYGGCKAPGNMKRLIQLVDMRIPLPFRGVENQRDFIHIRNLTQYLTIIIEKNLRGVFLLSDHQSVSTEFLLQTISKYLGKNVLLFKIPTCFLFIIKTIRPKEYRKLFGSLRIHTNFPYEELIQPYSVEDGIQEMVNNYMKKNDNT